MSKLKPSGYRTAAESVTPGYLQKRMREYREKVAAESKAREAKVRPISVASLQRSKP